MIESKNDTSKNLEKALQALEQAKQRVANEKKKQNEKKRKAENHHKYIMGGIIVKYFPDCYRYDEGELNRILSVALQTRECQQIISKIKAESRETTPPQSTLPNAENESEGCSFSAESCNLFKCFPAQKVCLRSAAFDA